tara:strand:+ start:8327 stop:8641 length:315 start_codon:yes stop_codon:yes gene_type:complete
MIRFFDAWDREIMKDDSGRAFYPIEKYSLDESDNRKENTTTYNEKEAVSFASERHNGSIIAERIVAYGELTEQLDLIYHQGIDVWKDKIKQIKEKYPKKTKETL